MMALCHGGTLCLVPRAALLPVDPLVRTLKDLRITLVTLPPSALSHLPLGCLPESVDINVTGENFPPALAKAWAARHRVFNGYGPTETSIWASTFELGGADFPASVPIGRPLPNEQLYVLNDRSALCPIGVAGELYIGGTPVGLGYFRRESLTAERFVPDEHSGCGSLYRTGDIAKWLHDGNLQFLGRKDTQVKIRGFRIELGEVEALIGDIDGIREAAVILTGDLGEQLPRLVAFFATVKGAALSPEQVRERLRKFLPEFMVPTAFVGLPTLPVTPNGKVDRNALTSLVAAAPALDSAGSTAVPADLHEAMLHELYRDLLRQPDINAGTDFFASGGHSLLAVRLVSRLRERHGVALPVREVFANSVLGDLARVVAKYAVSSGASNLTLLRAGRDEGAIFFVHAGDGEVGYAHQLLPALSTTLSVYALSASGLLEGEAPLDSVEAMARRYVEAMRTVSHDGPFRLVGWSAGGTIAYEMARYIRQLGSVVVVLALLDTHRDYSAIIVDAVSRCAAAPRPSEVLSEWLRQASLQGLSAEASNHLDTMPLGDAVRSCHDQGHLPHEIDAPTLTRWWQVRQHTAVAVGDYRPAPIDCRTVLFSARDEQRTDDSLGWRELLGDRLEIVPVGGSHQSMVRAPNASPLGRALSAFLQPDASSRSPAAHATSARPTGIPDSSTAAGPIA
jgi:thioesterase domain-containing protein